MTFAASIQCIDGRIHDAIFSYIRGNYDIKYIDIISEPGIDGILADENITHIDSIIRKVQVCVDVHQVKEVFLSAHYNCLANPGTKEEHLVQMNKSLEKLKAIFPDLNFHKIWIDENWECAAAD